jgi:FeS assembly SUF system protein
MNRMEKAMAEPTGSAGGVPQKSAALDYAFTPPTEEDQARLTDAIIEALKSVYDPEIPVDIYELGLIYKVDLSDDWVVTVDMTLTAPACPVAGEMPVWVQNAIAAIGGVRDVKVHMVFDPPWTPSRMSEEARLQLNML